MPVRIALLTVSDTRTLESDSSGGYLAGAIEAAGHVLAARAIVPDDVAKIRAAVQAWIDDPEIDAVISTGGTGLTGRDVTPEAVAPLFDKVIEGFAVVFHNVSFQSVGLSTIQSRACAGVANGTFVFCLPGSGGAVRDGWEKVIFAPARRAHAALQPGRDHAPAGRALMADDLTHFDEDGRPRMVDVSAKPETDRFAAARGLRADGRSDAWPLSFRALPRRATSPASPSWPASMAAKRTGDLIPLCHPLPLTAVAVRVEPDEELPGLSSPPRSGRRAAPGSRWRR